MALTPEAGKRKWESNYSAWVEKCAAKHGGKYTYPSNERVRDAGVWKVQIVCPEHGAFLQAPEKHAFGRGCPACVGIGTDKASILRSLFPKFPWPADLVIQNTKTLMVFVCPEHGEFRAHYNQLSTRAKQGISTPCPKCNQTLRGALRRKSVSHWVSDISDAHAGKVSVDPLSITVANEKARFVCDEHGEFWSVLQDVSSGHGCPQCGVSRRTDANSSDTESFVSLARAVHGDRYGYSESVYVGNKTPLAIVCKTHGVFFQRPNNHISNAAGCPACANNISSGEIGLKDWLDSSGVQTIGRDRTLLDGLEIDIYLPEFKIAVEYCGLYWHGENYKDALYHKNKHSLAAAKGVKLITVFEDEWLGVESRQKVMFRLLSMMNASTAFMARKTLCQRITWAQAKPFLDLHHMQGSGAPSKTCYGLFDGANLIAVSTWGKPRFDKSAEWELLRFSGAYSNRVVGGLGKMFSAFQREMLPRSVVTYADLRWGSGDAYEKIGFAADGETAPGYFWCKASQRFSRYDFQKHKLAGVLKDFDPSISEVDNCHKNGYWRIFDCGHSRWLWKKQESDVLE